MVVVRDFLPAAVFDSLRAALLEGQFDTREQLQGDTVTRQHWRNAGLRRPVDP